MVMLYVTADRIGTPTGGGLVTAQELQAIESLGERVVSLSINERSPGLDPFAQDEYALNEIRNIVSNERYVPRLMHCYSGCLTKTVRYVRSLGTRVTYTAAAHDVNESRKAHEEMGFAYDFPHINDPKLWREYVGGYLDADVLVCPSQHSADVMKGFGANKRLEVIPHGVEPPRDYDDYPKTFTIGYLGSYGPDKGVRYLLEAWGMLDLPDARMILGGAQSRTSYVSSLIAFFCKDASCIHPIGWLEDVSTFYDNISLYVQPSITEGFGIEVLEAMAHGRSVLCSVGAGASDVVPEAYRFPARDARALAAKITAVRSVLRDPPSGFKSLWVDLARGYSWSNIRMRYVKLWRSIL